MESLKGAGAAVGGRDDYSQSPDGQWWWWDGRQWQPVQPPPTATGRPGGGRWLIAAAIGAGVAVTVALAIGVGAASRGLRCGTPPLSVSAGGTAPVRVCQRASVGRVASVAMAGYAGHLVAVTAGVGGEPPDGPADLALLQTIVGAIVARGDAAKDDAWLSAHFDEPGDSQTVVNGILLRLTVRDTVRSLVIVPAPDAGYPAATSS